MSIKDVLVYAIALLTIFLLLFGFIVLIGYTGDTYAYNVTHVTVEGDPTLHEMTFEVMIVDSIDEEKLIRGLMLCPNVFGYTVVEDNPARYYYTQGSFWEGSGGVPFPHNYERNLILVVDKDNYPDCQFAGVTIPPSGDCVIVMEDIWTEKVISNVIYHECTHNIETSNQIDHMTQNLGAFDAWMASQRIGTYPLLNKNGWCSLYSDWAVTGFLQTQCLT